MPPPHQYQLRKLPHQQEIYRDPKSGKFLSKKKGRRRKVRYTRELRDRALPSDVKHIRLADGTRLIRASDYEYLKNLFNAMKDRGYDLKGFRTLNDIKSEYDDPKSPTARRRRQRQQAAQDRAAALGDAAMRALRQRRAS